MPLRRPSPPKSRKSPTSPKPPRATKSPFTPSQRRDELRVLLRGGWQPLTAVTERLNVSRATAFRRLKELGETDPLECKEEDRRSYWRLPPTREHAFSLNVTTSEMVALAFVRNALGFLTGTGIKEDLDALLARFSHALKQSDYAYWKNLDRKLFDVNEGVYDYSDKMDVVNDVVTAILREEKLVLRTKDGRDLKTDPYTLVLYKKGLYLLAYSHEHEEVRRFGLDKVVDTTRSAGDKFEYPAGFDPKRAMGTPFGIIKGAREEVVLRFDASVAHYVKRRLWHPTQAFREIEDGAMEMTLAPEGTSEIVSWVLSFGGTAEVIAPAGLREKVANEARAAAARYAG
jgi:predicted DNA-binding transcriptional regulator YafY